MPTGGQYGDNEEVHPELAVIDYGMGNLHSVTKALESRGAEVVVAQSPSEARGADGLVLPGVGHFGKCRENLDDAGFSDFVIEWVASDRPFLGICLGMQLLYEGSEEGNCEGLGVIEGTVRRLPESVRVPHMGWNTVELEVGSGAIQARSAWMFEALNKPLWFYFVHSFAAADAPEGAEVMAWTEHGCRFLAAFSRGKVWASQFHPEKSGDRGLTVLSNFVRLCGEATISAEGI